VSRNPAAKSLDKFDMQELDKILDRLSPLLMKKRVKVGT
jgi:hypothetical protein